MSGERQAIIDRAPLPVDSGLAQARPELIHGAFRLPGFRTSFLLGAAVGAAYLLVVGLLLSRRPATAVEARLAAATSGQADIGTVAASAWPDQAAAHQLDWIGLILDPGRTGAIIDVARATALLLVLAAALLIFPIARRLEFPRALAAAATAGTAVACGLVLLYAGINAGTVAVAWLSAAALLAVSSARYGRTAALAAGGVGVVCAPLAAVGVLVLGAHLVAVRAVAPGVSDRDRRLIVAALASGAAVVAILATAGRPLAPASAAGPRTAGRPDHRVLGGDHRPGLVAGGMAAPGVHRGGRAAGLRPAPGRRAGHRGDARGAGDRATRNRRAGHHPGRHAGTRVGRGASPPSGCWRLRPRSGSRPAGARWREPRSATGSCESSTPAASYLSTS